MPTILLIGGVLVDKKSTDERLDEVREETNCKKKQHRTFLIVIISIAILTLIISLLSVWGIIKLNRKVKIRKEQQTGIVSVIDQTGRHWDTVEL